MFIISIGLNLTIQSAAETINITSPGFPSCHYRNKLARVWQVTGLQDHVIAIHIIDFNVESLYDWVTFGDGHVSSLPSSVIIKLTGQTTLRTISSANNSIWIKLQTDHEITRPGFHFVISLLTDSEGKEENKNNILRRASHKKKNEIV